jgi:hypothetical protein
MSCSATSRCHWVQGKDPLAVQWSYRPTSPLLRSGFAQSTAGHSPIGDLTDSFVPSDESAVPKREPYGTPTGSPTALKEVPDMMGTTAVTLGSSKKATR